METIVWHGHHHCLSPLEDLGESFESRRRFIRTGKVKKEQAIRLALLKKASPEAVQAYEAARTEMEVRGLINPSSIYTAVSPLVSNFPQILDLHKKECGCKAWNPVTGNIKFSLWNRIKARLGMKL